LREAVFSFAYYPNVTETVEELKIAKTEALAAALSRDVDAAEHWISITQSWNCRLQVGVHLRRWELSPYHRMKSRILEDRLEELDHMLESEDPQEGVSEQISAVPQATVRLINAYRDEL
jgi:hypothetical protein